MTDRRNPYVVLGVPFGSTESVARRGFARASRRLKSGTHHRYSVEDLTWALHEVEQLIEDPAKSFSMYRIPADPASTDVEAGGIFSPQAEAIGRTTKPGSPDDYEAIKVLAMHALIRDGVLDKQFTFDIPDPYEELGAHRES